MLQAALHSSLHHFFLMDIVFNSIFYNIEMIYKLKDCNEDKQYDGKVKKLFVEIRDWERNSNKARTLEIEF